MNQYSICYSYFSPPRNIFPYELIIIADDNKLIKLGLRNNTVLPPSCQYSTENSIINYTKLWLQNYFKKNIKPFTLNISTEGTPFQKKVKNIIKKIPFGKIMTYKDIAVKINSPNAYRAVGNVCASNTIPLIIPCHRVVGKSNFLNYSMGGGEAKLTLLNHEGINI